MHQSSAVSRPEPDLSLPQQVILTEGWTRRGVAFVAGSFGALALAPVGFVPSMAITFVVAVWLIDGAASSTQSETRFSLSSILSAAEAGWWLGFGYFVAGLWWLGSALLVEADQFAWALPLAVLGVPAGLAVFTSVGFAFARLLWSFGSGRIFALAAGIAGAEWLRGHVLTGFPWNDFGMALAGIPALAQSASLIGLHGLDIIAVIVFAAPATLIDGGSGIRLRTPAMVAAVALLAGLGACGALRLSRGPSDYVRGVQLRLMQPNLPQDAKFKPENGQNILRRYLALSDHATAPGSTGIVDATHLIWPESAFPFILSREPQALSAIARAMHGKILITGAARAGEPLGPGEKARLGSEIFNSIVVVRDGKISDSYDKTHLVPFGEYLPLEEWLRPLGVAQLVPGVWEKGAGPRRLYVPGLPPVSPLICYEAIFPGEAVDDAGPRPQWLLNVTNDGWFGNTIGPYQHFAQARLRAIEEGLPLIRVANTGVSAIVDGYGRVLNELPLGVEGVIDGSLPKALEPTFFSRHGPLIFPALWALTFLCAALSKLRG